MDTGKDLTGLFGIIRFGLVEQPLNLIKERKVTGIGFRVEGGVFDISRDLFCQVPLYIFRTENYVAFSTSLRDFLKLPEFGRKVDVKKLYQSFEYPYSGVQLFSEIENIPRGYSFKFSLSDGSLVRKKHIGWEDLSGEITKRNNLDAVLSECIAHAMEGFCAPGMQLSGGVDSSLLGVIACERGYNPQFFSLVNRDYPAYSEEERIKAFSDAGYPCPNMVNFDRTAFLTFFERAISAFEHIPSLPSPIGLCALASKASETCDVLLSGDGADELCLGYAMFASNALKEKYPLLFRVLGKTVHGIGSDDFLMKMNRLVPVEECAEIMDDYDSKYALESRRLIWEETKGSAIERLRSFWIKSTLDGQLQRQANICLQFGLECRMPFLDRQFVSFALSLRERDLLHPVMNKVLPEGKWVLKKSLERRLGKDFAFAPKVAMRMPLDAYLQDKLFQKYIDDIIVPGIRRRGLFKTEVFNRFRKSPEHAQTTWNAICIEAWLQMFVDGRDFIDIRNV